MGTIRVEFVPVSKFGLGLLGLDHLQLTYEDETDFVSLQDYWYVLEGVVDGSAIYGGTLGVLGTDGATLLSSANLATREALVAKIGTPESRGSRPVLTSGSAINEWHSMADYGGEIDGQRFPYIGAASPFSVKPTVNSNSVISTLLWTIGIKHQRCAALQRPQLARHCNSAWHLAGQ